MAVSYSTPGVYIEEIPKFPPSIASVETAIPAFIGYTQKAVRNGESLIQKPTRIGSIAEYEETFGGAPSQNVVVFLDNGNNFVRSQAATALYLYDSLRMFYANGGGRCYIISVGLYPASNLGILGSDIETGLLNLAKEDEPTLILMPDAVSIDGTGPYTVQQVALAQCATLKDRFTLCDLVKTTDSVAFNAEAGRFRTAIGINALKYGAAYAPWINADIPRQIWRRNLLLKRQGTDADILLESLTTDTGVLNLIRDIKLAEADSTDLTISLAAITGPDKTLNDSLQKALDAYRPTNEASTTAQLTTALQGFTDLTFAILKAVQDLNAKPDVAGTKFEIRKNIASYLASSTLKNSVAALAAHHTLQGANAKPIADIVRTGATLDEAAKLLGFADGAALLADTTQKAAVAALYPATVDTLKKRADVVHNAAYSSATDAILMLFSVQTSLLEFEKNFNDTLLTAFGQFKQLVSQGAEALNLLPPGGAVAGVYARTDNERGVWKAPANVSLNKVVGPAVKISQLEQGEYNIDVNAGKSINIIRAFTGKGTLVWGARTLAGNDNEWRYVPVRRLFNFVEESVKKATEQFVFEPNDANTWVRVQAMIENFLDGLWRQGALQGIKPQHAFYVAVGLGKTMTRLDILEGRLIIEIGMAPVRPAEFIILRFSHKMAES